MELCRAIRCIFSPRLPPQRRGDITPVARGGSLLPPSSSRASTAGGSGEMREPQERSRAEATLVALSQARSDAQDWAKAAVVMEAREQAKWCARDSRSS